MLNLTLNFALSLVVLILSLQLVPEFSNQNLLHFLISFFMLGLMNFLIRPMLFILRREILPTELVAFAFIMNLLVMNIAAGLIDEFNLTGPTAAIFGSILMAIGQVMLDRFETRRGKLIS